MNSNIHPIAGSAQNRLYGIYVLDHLHLDENPERTRQALRGILPGDEDPILLNLLQRQRVLVRQGRFEALNTFAARLYSQGFQIELVLLD
ncbi:MAG: hypothetical protein ACOVMK_05280 [Arenimonas sp.]